jgi:hypothetical protein
MVDDVPVWNATTWSELKFGVPQISFGDRLLDAVDLKRSSACLRFAPWQNRSSFLRHDSPKVGRQFRLPHSRRGAAGPDVKRGSYDCVPKMALESQSISNDRNKDFVKKNYPLTFFSKCLSKSSLLLFRLFH